jgi:1,4-alpha-glucan branching enzyme
MWTRFLALAMATVVLTVLLSQCVQLKPQTGGEEGGIPVRFSYIDPAAASVCVAGSFNGWSGQSDCMRRDGGTWTVALMLSPGRYEYGFVVDGSSWQPDPEAILSEDSGFGRLNSILIVE